MSSSKEIQGQMAQNGQNGQNGKQVNSRPVDGIEDKKRNAPKKRPGAVGEIMKMYRASRRPLPTEMGNGTYRVIRQRPTLVQDLRSFGLADLKTLKEIVASKLKGETQIDDKTMIMERTIQLVSGMPDGSKRQEILTNKFIGQLWDSLEHPPLLYMGDKFRWRQPDGSNNNPTLPWLGAAGTPYSRACKSHITPLGALPDPEAVYEAVMARNTFKKNPNNVSSILWYWATIIIHDLFHTNMKDPNINDSSSYLDLSPLYGSNQEQVDSIRTFKDGKLKPDAFADKRLLGNPPGVCIILIMFNRFHNRVATNLVAINEGNRFDKPSPSLSGDEAIAAWKKYDEEIFQTARLVTSGLYINITLVDYVRNIVNLNRVDTQWTLDPRQEMGVSTGTAKGSESGVGNSVSAEFNLCYRWHSCLSEMDDQWIQDFYEELLGENYGTMDIKTLITAIHKFAFSLPKDPGECTFGGFTRGPDGKFDDDELVNSLATAIEQPGGSFGAQNVPRIMKPIEIMGILRGRKWHLAGLNEFRKHFGLKAYDTFEEINSDPDVANSLRHLYQHPDNVELYPGIVAEERKEPMVPGVGIAPTYTISRVVLSDAVALVRGDRHYTTDYNPGYLTNWGYTEANYDLTVNHGCVWYKLFMRAFPNHFKYDSVYAHYPMVIPSENRKILNNLNRAHLFSFERPRQLPTKTHVTSYGAAKHVITNEDKYPVWQDGFALLTGNSGLHFSQSSDQRKTMESLLYKDGWRQTVKAFYVKTAEQLLAEKSYILAGRRQVDIVRDVGNVASTRFISNLFNIPLKTKDNPKGVFSEHELYTALAAVFSSIFLFDADPMKSFVIRQKAMEVASQLGQAIETNVKLTKSLGLRGLFTGKAKDNTLSSYGVEMVKGLAKGGMSPHEIAWGQILPTAGTSVPTQAQKFGQAVDWYLSPAGEPHLAMLQEIATREPSAETDNLLLGYAMEGVRLTGPMGLNRYATSADTIIEDDGRRVNVDQGGRIFVSLAAAARDPAHFPNPDKVDPRRPLDAYIYHGAGSDTGLGKEVGQIALVELFRALFSKRGLKRVAGPQGQLKKVPQPDGSTAFMTEDWGSFWPFPTTMKVTWDGE